MKQGLDIRLRDQSKSRNFIDADAVDAAIRLH